MYSTCIFCNSALGANEILEDFPVGRRIAFDSTMGRLWVVCRACERWNLSPLDDRWEIVEECERQFSMTPLRVSSENIGLARLSEGLELVRVGKPMRPEMAAWRYGDQFGRRRRRRFKTVGAGLGVMGVAVAGGAVAGVAIGGFSGLLVQATTRVINGNPESVVARLDAGTSKLIIKRQHLNKVKISADDTGWQLLVPDERRLPEVEEVAKSTLALRGEEAQRAIAQLMPPINRFGGNARTVREAVHLLENAGQAEAFFAHAASDARRRAEPDLIKQPYPVRLALEMAAHEDAERRALEGELADLERAWKEAEEIASISDSLFTPRTILERIESWKNKKAGA